MGRAFLARIDHLCITNTPSKGIINGFMFASCIFIRVREEYLAAFIEITRLNHLGSRSEPGNLRFDVLQQEDDRCRFMLYEVWKSEEALEAHRKTSHYKEWKEQVEPWMAEPRRGIRHKILQPEDPASW